MPRNDFLAEAETRGFVHQCTDRDGLDAALQAGATTGYIGFDLTADSLHVGSMVQIMLLRLMQRHGHRPVLLLGGGTTKIGDPSGKEEARQLLATPERIGANGQAILAIVRRFVRADGPTGAIIADNADWLDRLGYIELLREVGPHVPVGRMLSQDSVRVRLEREQGLSFLEFNYSILQSYDFRELGRRHGVVLQMGGSDQWGNIGTGMDLGRRMGTPQLFALTTPLLTTAAGAKMGKTAQGAVWLDAELLPVFEYWQYWRNCDDADVGRFLRLFTELPMDEVVRLENLGGAEVNDAKKVLATEATALLHGRAAAEAAAETARRTFEEGGFAQSLPSVALAPGDLAAGLGVLSAFQKAGLVASSGEARRQVKGGGLRVNDVAVSDERAVLHEADLREGAIKLSLGRKRHVLLKVG